MIERLEELADNLYYMRYLVLALLIVVFVYSIYSLGGAVALARACEYTINGRCVNLTLVSACEDASGQLFAVTGNLSLN